MATSILTLAPGIGASTSGSVLVGSAVLLLVPALLAIVLAARHPSLQYPAVTLCRE